MFTPLPKSVPLQLAEIDLTWIMAVSWKTNNLKTLTNKHKTSTQEKKNKEQENQPCAS